MEEQRTMLVNLKEDFIQFEVKEPTKPIETKEDHKWNQPLPFQMHETNHW